MASPYDIYGKVVEYRCNFGRLFVHVNVAPRHKDRARLDAIEAAVRNIQVAPHDVAEEVLPLGYSLKVKCVECDRIEVRFRRLNTMPEKVIDAVFPHQKGGILEDDVFIDRLRFLPA